MLNKLLYQFRLTWQLIRDPRVAAWKKIIPFLGIIYVISPLDFIPDVILGLGQLDDVGLVFLALQLFQRTIDPALLDEHYLRLDGGKAKNDHDAMTITTDDYTVSRH